MTDFAALAASQLGGAGQQSTAGKPMDYASLAASQLASQPVVPEASAPPTSISPEWDKATEAHLAHPTTWLGPAARYAVGGVEALGAGAIGMGQQAAAGLTGLGRMGLAYLTGDDPQVAFKAGTDTINNLAAKLPIEPQTTAGQEIYKKLGLVGDAIQAGGDYVYDKTGSPLAGAAAQGAGTLASLVLPGKIGEAAKGFAGRVPEGLFKVGDRTPFEQTWTDPSPVAPSTVAAPVAVAPSPPIAPATGIDLSPYVSDANFMDSLSPQDRADLMGHHADATHPMVPDSVRDAALQSGAEIVGRNLAGSLPDVPIEAAPRGPAEVAGDTSDIDAILKSAGVDITPKPQPSSAPEAPQAAEQMRAPTGYGLDAVDPATASDIALQRHLEAQSLPVPVDLTQGQATGDIHQLSLEQNNRARIPGVADRFNDQNTALRGNLDAIRNLAAPDVATTGVSTDQALLDSIKAADVPVRADITAKYQALKDANGGEFPLSGKDFATAADTALKENNRTRFVPPEVKGILDDMREGGPMNFNDFENYRTILSEQQRKFARNGDGTAEYAVNLVRNALESLPMSDEAGSLKPLADAARSAAKARFDRIAADPAYKAAVNDTVPLGEQSPLADDFIKKYVVNGKTAHVNNLLDTIKADPAAHQLINAGVLDHIKQASGIDLRSNTGNISQSALNKAIGALGDKRAAIFDPVAAQHLETLGNVARYTQEQPRGSFVNNSSTLVGSMANKLGKGAEMAVNAAVPGLGLGTEAAKLIEKRSAAKVAKEILGPGAGASKEGKAILRGAEAAPVVVQPRHIAVSREGRTGIISAARRAAPVLVSTSASQNRNK